MQTSKESLIEVEKTKNKLPSKLTSSLNIIKNAQSPTPKLPTVNEAVQSALNSAKVFPTEIPIREEVGKSHLLKLMHPNSHAMYHDAIPLLNSYVHGCPVDCGKPWTKQHILLALQRGAHISAKNPIARKCLIEETKEKVTDGYARVITWRDIKNDIPRHFKLSPVAMIPHKSRPFRCILDLSFKLRLKNKVFPSVNSATRKKAPQKAMAELGNVLKRLITIMAQNYQPTIPFKFCKIDIKDGYWRMIVHEDDSWNFCYTIPPESTSTPLDDIQIVVPCSLQMGWCESPPFFCAASETARDIIEHLIQTNIQLPEHPLEQKMLPPTYANEASTSNLIQSLIEVYVDDFIGASNNLTEDNLQRLSRAILHGIHSIFPPTKLTGHDGPDPIAEKKLNKGEGQWDYVKEILGWVFDGQNYTIYLPTEKVKKLRNLIKAVIKKPSTTLKEYQRIAGKLNHASIGIPNGRGLNSPIYQAMANNPDIIIISPQLQQAFKDWNILLLQIGSRPTHVLELVHDNADYIGYVDACKTGIGGVWTSEHIPPTVWRIPLPTTIQNQLISNENPNGSITINDLEMAGVMLQWLALERCAPKSLQFAQVTIYSDNTSTVSWTGKLSSSASVIAGHLLRALALRQHVHRSAPLLCLPIAGQNNDLADTASRSFSNPYFTDSKKSFLNNFSLKFPLPQKHYWHECQLPKNWISRVTSCLLGRPLEMALWMQIPNQGKNIGTTGRTTAPCSNKNHTSDKYPQYNKTFYLHPLLHGSGQVILDEETKSKHKASHKHLLQSPRQSSWLANSPRSIKHQKLTPSLWHGQWKDGEDKIHLQFPS